MKADRFFGLRSRGGGFTLLELIVAFAILAMFVLPILEIMHASRVRAVKYTRERVVRDLAQRKLFDRVYYIEEMDSGTFEAEGHPDWMWEVLPPEMVGQGEQTLLQYTIRVTTPAAQNADLAYLDVGETRPAFEMSVWTFPSQAWYDEQAYLSENGLPNYLDGSAMGVMPGGMVGY